MLDPYLVSSVYMLKNGSVLKGCIEEEQGGKMCDAEWWKSGTYLSMSTCIQGQELYSPARGDAIKV